MYIAHSALRPKDSLGQNLNPQPEIQPTALKENELLIRYHAYRSACDKYHREIIAIQQYIPGWQPKFY